LDRYSIYPDGRGRDLWSPSFGLIGIDLPVPDHSTLSRRIGKVEVEMPVAPSEGAVHVVVDSTGVKVYGEGEWKVRQHGVDKRRTWRKLHIGVNEATGEILAAVASTNNLSDDQAFADLLDRVEEKTLASVRGWSG